MQIMQENQSFKSKTQSYKKKNWGKFGKRAYLEFNPR
jgi:hypothetical protein